MKFILIPLATFLVYTTNYGQIIKRVDDSKINAGSLTNKIEYLMQTANVSGAGISVFNNNEPVYSKTFGLADVQKKSRFRLMQKCMALRFQKWFLRIS